MRRKNFIVTCLFFLFVASMPARSQEADLFKVSAEEFGILSENGNEGTAVTFQSRVDGIIIKGASVNKGNCEVSIWPAQEPKYPVKLKYGEIYQIMFYTGSCTLLSAELITDRGELSWEW